MGDTNGQSSINGKKTYQERILGMASVLGSGLDVVEAAKIRKAAQESAKYRLAAARLNQQQAQFQAEQVVAGGGLEAAQQEGKALGVVGSQALGLAAQGTQLGTSEAVRLMAGSAGLGRIDAETIRHNAIRRAFGIQAQAESEMAKAYMDAAARQSQGKGNLLKAGLGLGKGLLNLI